MSRAWPWMLVVLLCVAADAALIGKALFTRDVKAPGDTVINYSPWRHEVADPPDAPHNPLLSDWALQFHPWRHQVVDSWRAGRAPLWNDLAACGQPLLANTQCEALSPYLPIALLTGDQQPDYKQLAQLLVAQLFCLLLAARLRMSALGGGALALTFSFASYMQLWVMHPQSGTAAFAPGLLWAFIGLRKEVSARRFAAASIVLALAVLSGHVETAFFGALGACIIAFFIPAPGAAGRFKFTAAALGAGVGGLLAASAMVLPFFGYLAQSKIEAYRLFIRADTGGHYIPFDHLRTLLDPFALGNPTDPERPFTGQSPFNFIEVCFHVGRLALALAAIGLVAGLFTRGRRGLVLALVISGMVGVTIAYAPAELGSQISKVPPFDRIPVARMWFLAQLPLAVLAALAVDSLARSRAWRFGLGVVLIVAVGGEGVMTWRDFVPTVNESWLAPRSAAMDALAERTGQARVFTAAGLGPPNLPSLHGVSSLRSYDAVGLEPHFRAVLNSPGIDNWTQSAINMPQTAFLDATATRWLLTPWAGGRSATTANDLVVVGGSAFSQPMPTQISRPVELLLVRPTGSINDGTVSFTVVPESGPTLTFTAGREGGTVEAEYGRLSLDRDQALTAMLDKYYANREVVTIRFDSKVDGLPVVATVSVAEGAPDVMLKQIVRNGFGETVERGRYGPVVMSERLTALPRAYLAPTPRTVDNIERAIEGLFARTFDPSRETLVEWRSSDPSPEIAPRERPEYVPVRCETPEVLSLTVEADVPSLLVVTDAYARGWKATVDGEVVPIHRANAIGRAIAVPAGRHEVRFEYQPASWRMGRLLSMFAGAALLVMLFLRP